MAPNVTDGGLVVMSNRLPITLKRAEGQLRVERSSGGLVAAMGPALRGRESAKWVGWPGGPLRDEERAALEDDLVDLVPVDLSQNQIKRYYHGLSNRTLWPLFHSFPESTQFDHTDWATYEAVNQKFGDAAAQAAEPGDLVFIHDYHLMTAPLHLRRLRPDAKSAFFLHIPFPPYDVYRILPWYRELLRGVLSCDLVGLHCPGYVSNFLDCVERLLGERVDRKEGLVEHGDRIVRVGAFPLGIDYRAQEALAQSGKSGFKGEELIVLGVDRLDYTKGIPERLLAFERLLEKHPDHKEKVGLLQIAVPSRAQVAEYQALKRRIDELVGRINGRFGTNAWTPIRYIYRSISPERLGATYRDAAVGLVTPLRDGMNLVAKEYVASQVDDPGVLILSRLAGAAERMPEALRVNPYNVDSVADRLHDALSMSAEERLARMRALQLRERRNDVHAWMERILEAAEQPQEGMKPLRPEDFEHWLGDFIDGRRLAIFLDYDGTVAQIARHPSEALLSDTMRAFLSSCVARRDTDVSIVSGRALDDVRKMVALDGIIYAGNHGLEIAGPGLEPFRHADISHYADRAGELAESLEELVQDGVWVEQKGASLTVHFREADPGQHELVADRAHQLIREAGFQARDALCAVEARPPIGWDKGHAVLHVLRARYGPAWSESLRVIYIGDDETDEDAFRALRGLGATFRVGDAEQSTQARRRLRDVESVGRLLAWLAERPEATAWIEAEERLRAEQLAGGAHLVGEAQPDGDTPVES
jgi:trehalose 6-phosphate synthase/phosphatase